MPPKMCNHKPCEGEGCEFWDKSYGRCDVHAFIRAVIDNGGLR